MDQPTPITTHTITAREFIDAVSGKRIPDKPWFYRKTKKEIKDSGLLSINIDEVAPDTEYIVLKNAGISHMISLSDLPEQPMLIGFILIDCILPDIEIFKYRTDSWYFRGCTVQNFKILMGDAGDIRFADSSCGDLIIESSKCDEISLLTSTCSAIRLEIRSICKGIEIRSESSTEHIGISHSFVNEIDLWRKCSVGQIILAQAVIESIVLKDDCVCDFFFLASGHCSHIEFTDSTLGKLLINGNFGALTLKNTTIPVMQLDNCNLTSFHWEGDIQGKLQIMNSRINHITMHKTVLLKESIFSLLNSQLYIAQFDNIIVSGQLIFRNITVLPDLLQHATLPARLFHAYKGTPYPLVETAKEIKGRMLLLCQKILDSSFEKMTDFIKDNPSHPIFQITNCSLGKGEITGSDLRKFTFQYRDSKLIDMFISGTSFPKENIQTHNTPSVHSKDNYEQKIIFYTQLKKIFDNQGNIVDAAWYHSKSLEYQERLLRSEYKEGIPRKQVNNWFEIKAFQLNRYSNNHGENWYRALIFVLCGSFIFYCIYYMSLFYNKPYDISRLPYFFADYLLFLDPLHKIDFLVEKEYVKPIAKLADFLGRLFTAYGIYQFITAFRKHSRKSGA